MMAQFSVLTRLKDPGENSTLYLKMRAYDGENLKDVDPRARAIQEYRDEAGVAEGMKGMSTRFAFKVLSKTFNYSPGEVAANAVHLMYVLRQEILHLQHPREEEMLRFIQEYMAERYKNYIGKEIQTAFVESYWEYGQNIFDRYVQYADFWSRGDDYRDLDTGEIFDRATLNAELENIENRPASLTRRISATNSSHSCYGCALSTPGKIQNGPAMRNYARSSKRRCSPIWQSCYRSFRSPKKALPTNRKNTMTSSTA